MDFFEHQAQAKAASQRLLFLFLALTIVVVIGVDFVIYFAIKWGQLKQAASSSTYSEMSFNDFVYWQFSLQGLAAASISIGILSFGCFMRWLDLRKGGGGLAVSIGARSLGFASKDCLLYTSPSPRDKRQSRMPSSA